MRQNKNFPTTTKHNHSTFSIFIEQNYTKLKISDLV